jgi:hypothetical protein
MKGRLKDLTIGLDGVQNLTLAILGDFREEFKKLKDTPVDVLIKKHRSLRSLDANAYAWVLINKIAEAITPPMDKQEVYLLMLRRYGQGGQVSIQTSQFESVIREFDYHKVIGTGMANGMEFTHADVLVGSSKYDTQEMAVLIDGIIQEARDLGIDTDTPEQIARFKERWAGK